MLKRGIRQILKTPAPIQIKKKVKLIGLILMHTVCLDISFSSAVFMVFEGLIHYHILSRISRDKAGFFPK